jgi:hypothetical protein
MIRPLVGLIACTTVALATAPKFYPDDPIWIDDDKAFDATTVVPMEDTNGYDFLVNTTLNPGEHRDVRALNVNTLDEVPDSSWFTNRIGRREMPIAEVVKGPDRFDRISLDGWRMGGFRGQGYRSAARLSYDRPERAHLSNRGRPAGEP